MTNSKNLAPAGENAIQVFSSEQFGTIRTAGTAENPYFCLADLCRVLEIKFMKDVKKRLNQRGVDSIPTPTDGGTQNMLFINEQNLYRLIMRSDKPQAEPFQDWVCGEVLPAIRKTGGYMVAKQDETPEEIMARALKVADDTLRRQQMRIEENEKTIKELAPLADYTKEVLQSTTTYTFTQVGKSLGFRSVAAFTDWLQMRGVAFRGSGQWLPYADYASREWFTTRTTKFVKSDGSVGTNMYTVITERGRMGLKEMLDEEERNYREEAEAAAKEGGAR